MLKSVYDDIKEDGGSVSVVYTTKSMRDPVTEVVTSGTPLTFETYGVKESFEISEIDGENIKVGDVKMLIPAYGFTFDFGEVFRLCKVVENSKEWTVVNVNKTQPGDTVLLYTAQLRG